MDVYLIPPEYVRQVYPDIDKFMDRLVPTTHGRFDKVDILHDMLTAKEHLWVVVKEDQETIVGMILTEITVYPRKRMLSIQYAAGDELDKWMIEALRVLENWAVDNECTGMEITGRRGWVKKLKLHKWEEEFVVVKKEGLKKAELKIVESEKTDGQKKRRRNTSNTTGRVKNLSKQTA